MRNKPPTLEAEKVLSIIAECSHFNQLSDKTFSFEFKMQSGSAEGVDGNSIPETQAQASAWAGQFSGTSNAQAMIGYIYHWWASTSGGSVTCAWCFEGEKYIVTCKRK